MPRFRPYIEAVQWTGTNVIEIRQFVRANSGVITEAVIRDGVLYLEPNIPQTLIPGLAPIEVPILNWVVRTGGQVTSLDTTTFNLLYEPDL